MRTATATPPRNPRPGRGWYVGAVLSAVVAVGLCLLGWRQADQASRIEANPVQIQGTITQLPAGSATYSQVSYQVDGKQFSAADLWLPDGAKLGDPICLQHAAGDPIAVRVCGKHYPQPVGIGLAQITVPVALVVCALCVVRIWQFRRANPAHDRVAAPAGLAVEGPPAGAHHRPLRRPLHRRRGRRRR